MKNKMKNKTKPQMPNLVMRIVADPKRAFDKARDFSQTLSLGAKRINMLSKAMLDIYNRKVSIACEEGEGSSMAMMMIGHYEGWSRAIGICSLQRIGA